MGNLINNALAAIAPKAALERELASQRYKALANLTGSETRWRGASRTLRSLRGWIPGLGSGKSDLPEGEKRTLAARSRDAFRNQPIARAAIMRSRTAIVGTGLRPSASVDWKTLGISEEQGKELNRTIDRHWRLYANDPRECDAEATLNAYQLQSLALVSSMLAGDCFGLTPFKKRPGCIFGTKLQLIDGARVSNPDHQADTDTLINGIQLDALGGPVIYHIASSHPSDPPSAGNLTTWKPVRVFGQRTGVRRALHIWNDKADIGAVRGAPFLAPILEPLAKLEQYSQAELTAAVVAGMFTVFIERDSESHEDPNDPLEELESGEDENVPLEEGEIALGNGAVVGLDAGEKANTANPGRPNANYEGFFFAIIKEIGAALEIPAEELLLYYSSSYSAARAAMLQAWRFYTTRRQWLVTQLADPWRAIWFDELVASGKIPVTGYTDPIRRAAYQRVTWTGPARGAIDELKEAKAAREMIAGRLSNRRIETQRMLGEDWDVVAEGLADEEEFLRDKGIQESAKTANKPETTSGEEVE